MFVSINSKVAPWNKVNSTIGVSKLVSFEGMPKQLPTQLVSGLMLRCDSSGTLLPLKSFNAGDTVELQTGPFSNFIAIVDTIDADKRIWVLMDLMGQKARVRVSAGQLRLSR